MAQELELSPEARRVVAADATVNSTRVFWGLVALNAACIAVMPVLPGHDTAQHLAYVRLMASMHDAALGLGAVYEAPDLRDPYVTTYRVLAWIAHYVPVELVAKGVLIGWSIALAVALDRLVRSAWRVSPRVTCVPALVAPFFVWSPVFFMGFLPFVLALAPLVAWLAASVRYVDAGSRRAAGVTVAFAFATSLLHAVAAAAGAVFLSMFWLARRDRRSFVALVGSLAVITLAQSTGTAHAVRAPGVLLEAVRERGILAALGIAFTHPTEKVNMAFASLVGPFPRPIQVVIGAGLIAALALALRARTARREPSRPSVRGVRAATLGFGAIALLAPASVHVPDDLSLIDFRLLAVAAMLGVVWLSPEWFARGPAARALAAVSVLATGIAAYCGHAVARESNEPAHLVRGLGATDRLLALPLHDASAFLDPRNHVLHYAAVWHTVRTAGMTSLFWARFSPRLPIGYRSGVEPAHPRDFWEWTFDPAAHLPGWTHLLVSVPPADEHVTRHDAYARVLRLADDGQLAPLGEEGRWRLYRITAAHTR